ncbi:cytochrome P450 monooxygenase-like protein [Xylariomycetidae sp. FL0641]|nr:cytochrome P450 monooxygenase-like protein [Xylariomycetidae sp. FL0641]
MDHRLPPLALAAGAIAHQGLFRHGDWHLHVPHILVGHTLAGIVLFAYLVGNGDGVYGTVPRFSLATTSYLLGLFSSMTLYRLFFHRTSRFHGPRLAAISKLWHVWQIRDSTNFRFLDALHKSYRTSSVVRTGPNELTLFHPSAFELLDGPAADTRRDVWYDIIQPRRSVVFTRDDAEHRAQRKVWAQAFSTKTMADFAPRIAALARALADCIADYGSDPVDLDEVMSWFSFDAMGEVLFGADFGLVEAKALHPAISHRDRALALAGPLGDAIWIALAGFAIMPTVGRVADWHRLIQFCEDHMKRRLEKGEREGTPDAASFLIKEYRARAKTGDRGSLDPMLSGNAITGIVAGSDTTRAGLVGIFWSLCKYPQHARKIQAELEGIDVNDTNILATLPHLNGVIHESMRLMPPILSGEGRIVGPKGLVVDNVFISPGTKVTASKYVIHRMESAFSSPLEFIPERWYSRPELVLDRKAYAPFDAGVRSCIGKPMAYAELRLTTAILLERYHVSFAPAYDPETVWRDMRDQVTCQPGKVFSTFEPRQKPRSAGS